jgi:hypothetical protein
MLGVAAICWVRNRDILSDLYDYSSMIAAAGKIEAGLKPYKDFRSTMQSACYALPRLVEVVFGRSYLGLTWGGLLVSMGGATVVFGLLRKNLGALLAALIAGAITLAGFAQHVVLFYNPLGILCFAIVTFGLVQHQERRPWRSLRLGCVALALMVAGTNKINFQALTLGFAGLLVLTALARGQLSWRAMFAWCATLLFFGVILPLALELAWTGASFQEWYFNVVSLAEARVGLVPKVLSLQSYLKPTHDLHFHVLFKSLHTVGLIILAIIFVAAWKKMSVVEGPADSVAPRNRGQFVWVRLLLVAMTIAAGIGGVLLTITNVEIITLTSLGCLIGATGLALAFGVARRRSVQIALGSAALLWMVVGGYAAWMGARVMFARETIDRATFVRLENAPELLRYMEGVRLDADLHRSLLATARELEQLKAIRGDLSQVLFAQTLEWLERGSPESILRGMPVWYDLGTSLSQGDGPWLKQQLQARGINRILAHPNWESWPDDFRAWLHQDFVTTWLGPVIRVHELRKEDSPEVASSLSEENPFVLIEHTDSHIHVRTTTVPSDQRPSYHASPWGNFFGRNGDWVWGWTKPSRIVKGNLIATTTSPLTSPVRVTWKIVADPEGSREIIWSGHTLLDSAQPSFRAPFQAEAHGRTLSFEISAEGKSANEVVTGWRGVRIHEVGEVPTEDVPPGLNILHPAKPHPRPDGSTLWFRASSAPDTSNDTLVSHAPFEAWLVGPRHSSAWRVTMHLEPQPESNGVPPVVMALWYKSGRLEILDQFVPPLNKGEFVVNGRMPEGGGWLGLVVRPLEHGRPIGFRVGIMSWEK